MSLINISNLSFSYDGGSRTVFDKVSLQLDSDWRLGLIGRNGKGKTTFLRLLAGELEYGGSISASVHFEYFLAPVRQSNQSADAAARAICPSSELWQRERELSLLNMNPALLARPFSELSGGERTKVMLAALFLRPGTFLLIDEPTNHLDTSGRRAVSAYLRRKQGFILVSHDRAFLDSCIDHVLSINNSNMELQRGNYSSWKQNRDYQDQCEASRQDKLKKDIQRLQDAAERAADWSDKTEKTKFKPKSGKIPRDQQAMVNRGAIGAKAARMMKRSKSLETRRENALEEKAGLLLNLDTAENLKIHPLKHHAKVLVEAVDLRAWYTPDHPVLQGLNFRLEQGQRLALTGANGSGKTSLLNLIAGTRTAGMPYSGLLRVAGGVVFSRVEQDLSALRGSLSRMCRDQGLDENLFRAILSRLNLSREYWDEDMRSFSDGQRKKAALARSLSRSAHLYIWDEPLNFMDVPAREQLEELLIKDGPTMIFVEHDQAFVEKVATTRLELSC